MEESVHIRNTFEQYARTENDEARARFALANPCLISKTAVALLLSVVGQTGPLFERLKELDTLRLSIARSFDKYPAGIGPIEREAKRVSDGVISLGAAAANVSALGFRVNLTPLYVHALDWHAEHLALSGNPSVAAIWSRLLAQACLSANSTGPVGEELYDSGITWIQTAGVAVASAPDGEMFSHASSFGEQLSSRLGEGGDLKRQADVLHALGSLYSDPISSGNGAGIDPIRQREWLRRLDVTKGAVLGDAYRRQHPLPVIDEMLEKGLDYFQRALPNREAAHRGITLKAIAQTMVFLAEYKRQPVDQKRVVELCKEALQFLPAGSYQYLAAANIMRPFEASAEAPPLPTDTERGPYSILEQAKIIGEARPREALDLLSSSEDFFATNAGEEQRRIRLLLMVRLIVAAYKGLVAERFKGGVATVLKPIIEAAQTEHWSGDQLSAAFIKLAFRTQTTNEEDLGLRLVSAAMEGSPVIRNYQAPMAFLIAELLLGAAVNAVDAGDPVSGIEYYAQALAPSLRLHLPSRTLELLDRIRDLAKNPVEGVVTNVLAGLAPIVSEIDRELGVAGDEALQSVYRQTVAGMGQTCDSRIISTLLQLAKGARFSAMLREGPRFDWRRDESAINLNQQIQQLQKQLGDPPSQMFDDILLVSPASSIPAQDGGSPEEQLANLQKTFDSYLTRQLISTRRRSVLIRPEVLPKLLDSRTVLFDYFLGGLGEKESAVYIIVYTSDEGRVFRNRIGETKPNVAEHGGFSAVLDYLGFRTLALRNALQTDSDDLIPPEVQSVLQDDFRVLLGNGVWAYLQELSKGGKDHLCIHPCGALRYYPMQLLGPVGQDLAQNWMVTFIPSLESLIPKPIPSRAISGYALGLTYKGEPFGLAELKNATTEIESVAKIFQTKPLLDADVTEDRVLSALKSGRWVHLCCHGAQNAAAPLFQHLYVSPDATSDGRLSAYEILGSDLRGLEVVTLGACDSALGRFDSGDNLSGLPAVILAAGASSIVASMWEMRDDAAVLFFRRFYESLAGGMSRLDAFRLSQLEVRKAFPQSRDWAAFCFIGAWASGTASLTDEDLYFELDSSTLPATAPPETK